MTTIRYQSVMTVEMEALRRCRGFVLGFGKCPPTFNEVDGASLMLVERVLDWQTLSARNEPFDLVSGMNCLILHICPVWLFNDILSLLVAWLECIGLY